MTLANPIKVSGTEPTNTRKTIIDLVKGRYETLLSNVADFHLGVIPVDAIPAFPSIGFISSDEEPLTSDINTILDSVFTIVLVCITQSEHADVLDEGLNNFIHAVKKVAWVERNTRFGDTNKIIGDSKPGGIKDATGYLPTGYVGFEFSIMVHYREDVNNL